MMTCAMESSSASLLNKQDNTAGDSNYMHVSNSVLVSQILQNEELFAYYSSCSCWPKPHDHRISVRDNIRQFLATNYPQQNNGAVINRLMINSDIQEKIRSKDLEVQGKCGCLVVAGSLTTILGAVVACVFGCPP